MKNVKKIFNEAGYECRSYSGRYMYGTFCLGVELDEGSSIGTFFASVLEAALNAPESENGAYPEGVSDVVQAFRDMKTDSMGRGTIVYFPDVRWVAEESDDEDSHECSGEDCCSSPE